MPTARVPEMGSLRLLIPAWGSGYGRFQGIAVESDLDL
jgi:hypothetical protein